MSDTTEIDFDGLQAVAEAANQEEWIYHDREVFAPEIGSVCQTYGPMETEASPNGRHIAAFDPSTALALLALARRAVDAEAEAAQLREENGALVAALKAFVNDTITTTATRDLWWCSHPTCKFMDHAQTAGELRHHPDCPVPGAEALLAQAKGDTK